MITSKKSTTTDTITTHVFIDKEPEFFCLINYTSLALLPDYKKTAASDSSSEVEVNAALAKVELTDSITVVTFRVVSFCVATCCMVLFRLFITSIAVVGLTIVKGAS